MTETITQRDLRDDNGRIMRQVEQGETFMVTNNARPVAELRPLHRSYLSRTANLIDALRILPPIDAQRFRDDVTRC